MGYCLPMMMDKDGAFVSWIYAKYDDGSRAVLAFDENSEAFNELVSLYVRTGPIEGVQLGALNFGVPTLVDLATALEKFDPEFFKVATLIPESDPAFAAILEELKELTVTDLGNS